MFDIALETIYLVPGIQNRFLVKLLERQTPFCLYFLPLALLAFLLGEWGKLSWKTFCQTSHSPACITCLRLSQWLAGETIIILGTNWSKFSVGSSLTELSTIQILSRSRVLLTSSRGRLLGWWPEQFCNKSFIFAWLKVSGLYVGFLWISAHYCNVCMRGWTSVLQLFAKRFCLWKSLGYVFL